MEKQSEIRTQKDKIKQLESSIENINRQLSRPRLPVSTYSSLTSALNDLRHRVRVCKQKINNLENALPINGTSQNTYEILTPNR